MRLVKSDFGKIISILLIENAVEYRKKWKTRNWSNYRTNSYQTQQKLAKKLGVIQPVISVSVISAFFVNKH